MVHGLTLCCFGLPTDSFISVEINMADTTKTGGRYIPPFKLAQMRANLTDHTSDEFQRAMWEALRKSINGLINKVTVENIRNIVMELFRENLVRGKGVFVKAVMKAQAFSPMFTHVYSALVAVINTKLPEIGELLVKRLIMQFKRSYKRNDKAVCINSAKFLCHLVNQHVTHEV